MSTSSIPSWAVPGAKVVCVDGGNWLGLPHNVVQQRQRPVTGEALTIRKVWSWSGRVFLQFADAELGFSGFGVQKFRPVVDDDTEAQLFRKLRNPSRSKRKDRRALPAAGTGEGGGATPCVAAALADFCRSASGTLPRERERVGLCAWRANGQVGRQGSGQVGKQVEHGLDQSFSGFGTVGKPAATPETRATCTVGAPASPRHAAGILPGERA